MEEDAESSTDNSSVKRCRILRSKSDLSYKKLCAKEERSASIKKVSAILQKHENERTIEDNQLLLECQDLIEEIQGRQKKREAAKRRQEEFEDPPDVLNEKCQILAQAIAQSQHLVFYTGAGISTAAKIPDYRGPNGIWTRLQQGKDIGNHDLSLAEPTYTHMALAELYHKKILKYIVSQNCDGLHLRSGLPRTALSELHGNMNIEVCKQCKPHKQYWRLFDVTENTGRCSHKTYRRCYSCNGPLEDTIVHFGERGRLSWPLNWSGAIQHAARASTIVCLGSSLRVLKRYPWLWQMDRPLKKRSNLYIVNLQWTPKDDVANLKLNGRCDIVMRKVMSLLGISVSPYQKHLDPIYAHATELHEMEVHTTTQPILKIEDSKDELKVEKTDYDVQTEMKDCANDLTLDLEDDLFNCDNSNKKDMCLPEEDMYTQIEFFNSNLPLFLKGYSNLFLYPYQTSFLYSGLHSIINPVQTFAEDKLILVKREVEDETPECGYCNFNYESKSCLFYLKCESVFLKELSRYSKVEKKDKPNVCLCCDYSTEEEDCDSYMDSTNKTKIQAGWFGKGYRKGRKTKKKTL